MKFTDKIIWITGASSGIGAALAQQLSREGAQLILSARRKEKLEEVQAACENPASHLVLPIDLSASDSFQDPVRRVQETFGRVDVLINNGGVSQRSRAIDTSLEVDRRIMDVNYFGAIALTKAVLPGMLERRSGHIVCVSSLVGKFGTPLRSAYSASKHALHGFFDSLRAEVWRDGIKVTIVCPGFVRTDVSINALTGDGTSYGAMDAGQDAGMSAGEFANKMVRVLAKAPEEICLAGKEVAGVYAKRFAPRLFSRIIRKAKVV